MTRLNKDNIVFIADKEFHRFFELQPHKIWRDTPAWSTQSATYMINNDGIHAPRDYNVFKPQQTFRVMTIGDSFTFGQFVNTADNFSEQLRGMLANESCGEKREVEVINLGIPAYDIAYAVRHFDRIGKKYNPDFVIWLINTHNFISRDLVSRRLATLSQEASATGSGRVTSENGYYDAWVSAQESVMQSMGKERLMDMQLSYIQQFFRLYHGPLLVLVQNDMADSAYIDFVSRAFVNRSKTIVDFAFPDITDYRFADSHPNEQGHMRIAAHIYQQMQQYKSLICSQSVE